MQMWILTQTCARTCAETVIVTELVTKVKCHFYQFNSSLDMHLEVIGNCHFIHLKTVTASSLLCSLI